jgi:UrcA family protein
MLKIALLAATAAALAASAAHATTYSDATIEVRVHYADLEVAGPDGARALMQRIAKAAAQVCGGGPDSVIHDDRVRFDHCRAEAFGRAVKQLDPQIVTAVADYPPRTQLADAR